MLLGSLINFGKFSLHFNLIPSPRHEILEQDLDNMLKILTPGASYMFDNNSLGFIEPF